MTGELSEASRDLVNQLESHKLISAVFSALQLSPGKNTGTIAFGHSGSLWYILAGRKTASASIADYMFYTNGQERSASERSSVLSMADEINRTHESSVRPVKLISLENSGEVSDMGFSSIMVDPKSGELMKGTNYSLGDTLAKPIEISSVVSSNFPHPFHPELDMFLKSLFLTRGLMIKPPLSRRFIMENLVEDTYQHSIGIKRDVIKREFQDILREMVGSRVFRVKGAYVTYLTDITEYRRRYQREYLSYMNRMSRKTIFDFDRNLY